MTLSQRFGAVKAPAKKKVAARSWVQPRGRLAGRGNELKFFDTVLTWNFDATAEVPTTGGQLNLIPQGVTESNRVGRKCVLKSIRIEGTVSSTTGVPDVMCIMVVLDKQANGAAAAAADVVTSASLASAGLVAALPNLDNSDRFVILKKMLIPVGPQYGVVGAVGSAEVKAVDWYHKCNIPIEFDSTAATGAITTIRSNNVFLLAGSSGVTDDAYSFTGNARVRFSDN